MTLWNDDPVDPVDPDDPVDLDDLDDLSDLDDLDYPDDPYDLDDRDDLQGVPKVRLDFVFVIFSGSGAHTEELLTFVHQPWKLPTW